jgi:outer membrane protein assembly factor BamB
VYETQKMTRSMTGLVKAGSGNTQSLKPGSLLQDRYSVLQVRGVGGMGSVYQARDMRFPNATKYVAVKEIVNIADAGMREMVTKIFEREANTLAALDHPAIPKIFDFFTLEDRSFLIMEFIDGRDLENVLNDTAGFLPETTVMEWAIQLCDVLSYLHGHTNREGEVEPIVFRDLKPSNIMLDHHQRVRLIDFGIARLYSNGQRGTMIGTEGYSPPEQYRGEASPTGDIYALGATLHHLLTKQDPRLEPPFSFSERPIRNANKEVSLEMQVIIETALNYNPTDRFPTAQAMKEALIGLRRRVSGMLPAKGGTGMLGTVSVPVSVNKPAGAVEPKWVFKCEDEIRSTPVVHKGNVYVGAYDNNLYSVSLAEGKLNWKYATEGGLPGSPAAYQDVILIGSEDRRLHAVAVRSGRIQWSYYADAPIRSTPRVADGVAFFGADDNALHAVNLASGRRAWKYQSAGIIRSRPFVTADRVYFGCESGDLYGLDLRGEQRWRFKAKRALTSSPLVANSTIYVGCIDGMVYALDTSSSFPIWRFRANKPVISSPALDGNLLYIGSADNNLYAIDIRTGREAWHLETQGQVNSSPAVVAGVVYVGSTDGAVYAVDAGTGRTRWTFKTGGAITSSPVVADGVVYIGSFDRHLYALPA